MMLEKKETVLLITGATSDIGMCFIRQYHADYDRVVAHCNRAPEKLEALRQEMGERLIPFRADFTSQEDTRRFIGELQNSGLEPTHVLLLSALPFSYQSFHKLTWEAFSSAFDVAFRSAVMVLKACLPAMRKRRAGHITFMLSQAVCGSEAPACMSHYVTAKYALLGLMRALASEYKQYGIQVNGLSPSFVDTKFISEQPDIIVTGAMEKQGQTRMLTVEETAAALNTLLRDPELSGQNLLLTI